MRNVKFLFFGILCSAMILSCGEAGVQIKVGGDYETDFTANQPGLEFATSFSESSSTSVNSEIREYGRFITELEVKSLVITLRNFREDVPGSLTGEVTITTNGIDFTSGNVNFTNGAVIPLNASSSDLANLSNSLRSRDLSLGLSLDADGAFEDNNFDIELAINAFATVQVDQ